MLIRAVVWVFAIFPSFFQICLQSNSLVFGQMDLGEQGRSKTDMVKKVCFDISVG